MGQVPGRSHDRRQMAKHGEQGGEGLYMSTAFPNESQKRMTSFIIMVYVPSLEIRQMRDLMLDGSRHLFASINRAKTCCTHEEVELLVPTPR